MATGVQPTERRDTGGIAALADLIERHRGCFEYDWRARFHLPLSVVGRSMTYGEAIRLTQQLAMLPDSHVASALAGWQHPVGRGALVLMDLYDLQHTSKAKRRPAPYPRPWLNVKRTFAKTSLTRRRLHEILDAVREE